MAYQGIAQGLGPDAVNALYDLVAGDLKPDLTLILDLPVSVGLDRAVRRDIDETRYERMGTAFHEALRQAFLDIAADAPDRGVVVDANAPIETVETRLWGVLRERLGLD